MLNMDSDRSMLPIPFSGNGSSMNDLQQDLSVSLSLLIRNSIRIARRLLSSGSDELLFELPQTIHFNSFLFRVNPVHSTNKLDNEIQEILFRLQMMNIDLCQVIAMWFLVQNNSIRIIYRSIQELVTDIVTLLIDLEYERRIQAYFGPSETEQITIRDECLNAVLSNHKAELNEMLQNLNLVKGQETLASHRVSDRKEFSLDFQNIGGLITIRIPMNPNHP